jgi:predicted MFS family arabinose efflux permease
MQIEQPVTRLWNRSYILMLALNTLTATGFSMINPLLAAYAVKIGATLALAGLVAGIFAVMALIARPLAGFAVDRVNKKHLLMIATVCLALTTFCYALAPTYQALLIVRIMHGLFFAVSSTCSTSLGTCYIPPGKLGEGIGYLGLSYILAMGVGPNLGLVIADRFSYHETFIVSSLIIGLSAMGMFLLKNPVVVAAPQHREKRRIRVSDLVAKELLLFSALGGCFSLMNGLINSFLVLMAQERQIANISLFFTVNAFFLLIVRPLAGRLIDQKRLAFILYPAFVMTMIAAILLGVATSLWVVLLASAFYSMGMGAGSPAIQTTCIRKLGPGRVGVAISTFFIGADVGQSLGAILGGSIAGALGFRGVYFSGALVLLAGLLVFFLDTNRAKHQVAQAGLP